MKEVALDNTIYYNQHPLKVLSYTSKFFWLLLIPALRSLVAVKWNFATWVRGTWIDIICIILIFCFAYIRWYNIKYSVTSNNLIIKTGVFIKDTNVIPFKNVTSFHISRNYFLNWFNYNKLTLDTNSGSGRKPDIVLGIRSEEAEMFHHSIDVYNLSHDIKSVYTPKKLHTFIFSLIFSNTLSGAILIATLVYQSGQYIGKELERKFITTVNQAARKISLGLPPAAVYMAIFILTAWILSFVLNILRYWNFEASRKGPVINVRCGYITKRLHQIYTHKINYITFKQSLFTKIFKISSLHLNCTGYGKAKRELAVLVPLTTRKEIYSSLKMLLPEFKIPKISIRPGPHQVQRYIFFPVIYILAEPLIAMLAINIFPAWNQMIVFALIIAEIPTVWFFIVKIVAKYTCGIGANSKFIIMSCSKLYTYSTTIIPVDKITQINIRQSIFQKFTNDCTLIINTFSEHNREHRVDNIQINEVNQFLNSINYTG